MQENTNRKYLSNTIWLFIERASRIISGVLVGVLVARYLGASQFGMISYALTITLMLSIFSTLGMDSIIIRELVKSKESENEILGTAFYIKLLGGCITVLSVFLVSYFGNNGKENIMLILLISFSVLFQSLNGIDFYFQSQVKGRLVAINQVITLTLSALIKLYLIYIHAPLTAFAFMVTVEAIITCVNQILFYKKQG